MLIKTAALTGNALNWAVASAKKLEWLGNQAETYVKLCAYSPSTNQEQAGHIVDKAGIRYRHTGWASLPFEAWIPNGPAKKHSHFGETALIAEMRCFVQSKLGDEVDVPESMLDNECKMIEALKGAESSILKALPYLPADKEAVYCGEWLVEIRQVIAAVTGRALTLGGDRI